MGVQRVVVLCCFGAFVLATTALAVIRPDISLMQNQISDLLVGDTSAAVTAAFLAVAAGAAWLGFTYAREAQLLMGAALLVFAAATASASVTPPHSLGHNIAALSAFLMGPVAAASATWLPWRIRGALVIALIGTFALWPLGAGLGERLTVYGQIAFFGYAAVRLQDGHVPHRNRR